MGQIVGRAIRDPSFALIFIGFFSCGYQLGFITAHFPAFVTELCGPIAPGSLLHGMGITTTSALGAVAISLIGLANIVGTITAGWLGNHFPKRYLLALIYTGRTIAAGLFIILPITPETVIAFSIVMGALWLATVPLTSGLVGQIYGLRYMGTLYGAGVLFPPTWQLYRRLAGRRALRHLRRLHRRVVDRRRRGRAVGHRASADQGNAAQGSDAGRGRLRATAAFSFNL